MLISAASTFTRLVAAASMSAMSPVSVFLCHPVVPATTRDPDTTSSKPSPSKSATAIVVTSAAVPIGMSTNVPSGCWVKASTVLTSWKAATMSCRPSCEHVGVVSQHQRTQRAQGHLAQRQVNSHIN